MVSEVSQHSMYRYLWLSWEENSELQSLRARAVRDARLRAHRRISQIQRLLERRIA